MQEKRSLRWASLYSWCERALFPIFLFFYPFRHIHLGVEWWDTGYNYGNFLYMDHMDPMWVFSTYLGNAMGNFFTKLPFGQLMIGMNAYTSLLVCLLTLAGYYFFTKKVKLPSWIAFAGEVVAINLCWCPTALLYNYLTYVLFGAGLVALYCALAEEKRRFFVIAGICLGINVFVRFPNLTEMGMIVGVWAYGIIRKKRIAEVIKETGLCILGYVLGAGLCLGYISIRYGLDEYVAAIMRLLSMPSEAGGYTPYSMVLSQMINYEQNLIWLGYLAVFTLLGILGFAVLPGKLVRLKQVGYVACVFAGFYFLMMRDMFTVRYTTKESVYQWAVFLLTATIVSGVITIFRKKATPQEKLLSGLGILVIFITPLGSNNHLYSSINNLFFVAPFTLWMLYRLLRWLPGQIILRDDAESDKRERSRSFRILLSFFPVKAMLLCMLFMLGIQSICFGVTYVFTESSGGENLHTRIEKNDVLKGMYTSPDRAEVIESITAYIKENALTGQEIILYGWIPSMSYYLHMPFAITSWPDLESYNYSVMRADLERIGVQLAHGERKPPVILLEAGLGEIVAGNSKTEDEKLILLCDWMEQYSYKITFENEKFILLQADF